jgi:hypothetical protein
VAVKAGHGRVAQERMALDRSSYKGPTQMVTSELRFE